MGLAYEGRAHIYKKLKKVNEAIADYTRAIDVLLRCKLDKNDDLLSSLFKSRGYLHKEISRPDLAAIDFQKEEEYMSAQSRFLSLLFKERAKLGVSSFRALVKTAMFLQVQTRLKLYAEAHAGLNLFTQG